MRLLPVVILIVFALSAIQMLNFFGGEEVTLSVNTGTPALAEDQPADGAAADAAAEGDAAATEPAEDPNIPKKEVDNPADFDQLLKNREDRLVKQTFSDAEVQLLTSLKKRRDALDKRERQLKIEEKLVNEAQRQLEKRLKKLERLEASIKTKIGQANQDEEDRFASLVKTYETMKAKEAASIISILDINIMEKLARAMQTKKLAAILAKMDKKAARALTVRLAQPPKEISLEEELAKKAPAKDAPLPSLDLE